MKSLTHKLLLILLAMAMVPLIIGINALFALRTAGNSLNLNDRALQNLTGLLSSAGESLGENARLQESANAVAGEVNRAQADTARALKKIGESVMPKTFDISRIRFALGNVSAAERALLLALNMRHLDEKELMAIREAQVKIMTESFQQIEDASNDYLTRVDSPSESLAWEEFEKALDLWRENHDAFMAEIKNLDQLVDDLVRGGPLFVSASRRAYDTIFATGKEARELCERRIDALSRTLSGSAARSVASTTRLQESSTQQLRDLEQETADAYARSHRLSLQIDEARKTTDEAAAAAAQAMTGTSRRFWYLFSLAVAGVIAAIVFGVVISRRVTRPVRQAAESMTRLARGELIDDIPAEMLGGRDEIGQMCRAMQGLIGSYRHEISIANAVAQGDFTKPIPLRSGTDQLGLTLRAMLDHSNSALGRVHQSVGRVGEGANQVSVASQSLSDGAQTSAAALEEITQSVFHVDLQAKDNAKSALEASGLATASRDAAQRGYDAVSDLVAAMAEIQAEGKRIATVAKLIDDIAFQTNLLALNAAVEAARAGRYGKGFSVVADEVRNLSGRSARAARETGKMVASMTERMAAGMEMAEKSDGEFREIVEATGKVVHIFGSISDASNAQSMAVAQIARGLEQIDEVIQQNTHNAEATAMSAQWLSAQAGELRESVSRFKLLPEHLASGDGAGVGKAALAKMPEYWRQHFALEGGGGQALLPTSKTMDLEGGGEA